MLKVVSWNVHQRPLWAAAGDADVLLLQECPPGLRDDESWDAHPGDGDWLTGTAAWRTAVAVRAGGTEPLAVVTRTLVDLHSTDTGALPVSRSGTLAAVEVERPGHRPLILASAYARWQRDARGVMWADANAHRILADLSVFLTGPRPDYDVIVAGDWNLLHGYSEGDQPATDRPFWKARYDAVFAHAAALGLTYAGPRSPNGRQADPWPPELPDDSGCVPTFHSNRKTPATAARQLDHVFVSTDLADQVRVRALNDVGEWGPSDHCRIEITVAD